MVQDQALTDEQKSVAEKVEKLLRLAGKNTNQAEAEAAMAKAMAMLEAANLSMDAIDETGEGSGRRAEEKLVGGFYEFERDLWNRVGELNFCLVFHRRRFVRREIIDARSEAIRDPHRRNNILRGEFRIIGRQHNIAATKVMAGYLMQTIERLTRERLRETLGDEYKNLNSQMRSRWAVSYREGIAESIARKLWDRREAILADEEREAEAARRRAEEAATKGMSTATGVSLASLAKTEREGNIDFIYGEGTSARWAAQRAEEARRRAEHEAYMTQLAASDPKKYAKLAAEQEKAERRMFGRGSRGGGGKERDWSAFSAGRAAGASVSIDPQAGSTRSAGGIGHTAGRLGHG